MMRALVRMLRGMYLANRVDDEQIDTLIGNGKITPNEADYIKTGVLND